MQNLKILSCTGLMLVVASCGLTQPESVNRRSARSTLNSSTTNQPDGDNLERKGGVNSACDVKSIANIVGQNCFACHANGAALGGFTIDNYSSWTKASPELLKATQAMHTKTMPPYGAPGLNAKDLEVVATCAAPEAREEPSPSPTPVPTSPGDVITAECNVTEAIKHVQANCAACHGNGNALGNYSIANAANWTKTSEGLARAASAVHAGVMPPPGAPKLSSTAVDVLSKCIVSSEQQAPETLTCNENSYSTSLLNLAHNRRLTRVELENTLIDLFGSSIFNSVADRFALVPEDSSRAEIGALPSNVGATHIDAFHQLAEVLSAKVIASNSQVTKYASCLASLTGTTAASSSCINTVASTVGTALFRHPPTSAELTLLKSAYNVGAADSAKDGLRTMLEVALQSPSFLYLVNVNGTLVKTGLVKLDNYELANKLSYAIWGRAPDAALMTAARDGTLTTPSVWRAQVKRLLAAQQAKDHFRRFYRQWLGTAMVPPLGYSSGFLGGLSTSGLRDAMIAEIDFVTEDVTYSNGSFADLLTTRKTKLTSALAAVYGVSSSATTLPANERSGVLTRAAMLVRGEISSPYAMAKNIYRQVLACEDIDPPTASQLPPFNPADPATAVDKSYRQRFELLTIAPNCIGCHNRLNGIGFTFGPYDAIGRFRTKEIVRDANGTILRSFDIDALTHPFIEGLSDRRQVNGPVEFSDALAASTRANLCFTRQLYRRAQMRRESDAELCRVDRARQQSTSILGQLEAILVDEAFTLHRYQ